MSTLLLPTTLVGSYPQPDWLIDREMLTSQMPPRTRLLKLWRVAPEWLEEAQDDAALIAIGDQERAGIDIVTDGEVRRESYSNQFATALEGIDLDNPGSRISRTGTKVPVPRVVGKIRRKHAVNVRDITTSIGWVRAALVPARDSSAEGIFTTSSSGRTPGMRTSARPTPF